ncbi:MAG: MarC family protein [Puniceicoccales bacterium]|jgi:multiple antibiotic resistance protein|nr:MarC family protein [Puniceicoccales bacterium]
MATVFRNFLRLFIIFSPPSAVAVLLALTARHSGRQRIQAAAIACAIGLCVLVCVALTGPLAFEFFSVSLQAFKIAGGLFLAYIGVSMVLGPSGGGSDADDGGKPADIFSFAITPLGVPIICGPGTISTVILLGGDMTGFVGRLSICASVAFAVAALFAIMYVCVKFASKITPFALDVASRLTGVFIIALGSTIALGGLTAFVQRGSLL